ncbi:MAG: tryptophan synthase subunit alpha [Rhodothermales bacterium]
MSRLSTAILAARPALGIFLTAGFPSRADTLPVLRAIEDGGADFIELGMPFSDPLAEGLPIQRSSKRALEDGMTMQRTLDMAAAFRAESTLPLLLMGYANPVLRYGPGNFFRACRSSGVDGVILPDVPLEEAPRFTSEAAANDIDFVFLVSPTTSNARMQQIDQHASGFVYAVSVNGITGTALGDADSTAAYLKRARTHIVQNPLMVGFGIRNHDDVVRLSPSTDGCIVGSALVGQIEQWWDERPDATPGERLDAVRTFVHSLKNG